MNSMALLRSLKYVQKVQIDNVFADIISHHNVGAACLNIGLNYLLFYWNTMLVFGHKDFSRSDHQMSGRKLERKNRNEGQPAGRQGSRE